jgi:hypothetical protein
VRGYLATLPQAGVPMILFAPEATGSVARLITSMVERVLADPEGSLFVQTGRSVYRVTLDEPIAELPPPSRVRLSFDGAELTVAPAAPTDDASGDVETID